MAALVIDHDIYFIDIVSDSSLVFDGEEGKSGKAIWPLNLRKGMNKFLSDVDVIFRRDHDSHRPRINKPGSRKDREQNIEGEYFYVEKYPLDSWMMHGKNPESFVEGVKLILKNLSSALINGSIKKIEIGENYFDPTTSTPCPDGKESVR